MAKRIENKTSRTAEFTCLARYMSYKEKRKHFKSEDYISAAIMNGFIKFLIKLLPFIKKQAMGPIGMYEYVIARTKTIDEILTECLKNGAEQILVLGAGFDSRSIRLNKSQTAIFFELDAPTTQKAKIDRYKQKGLSVPDNVIFIPIDFDKQNLSEQLSKYGFKTNKKSVFIMEGLLMYLQPESIHDLLNTINEFAGNGSTIIADSIYASVIRGENIYLGEKELRERTNRSNEKFAFGINMEDVSKFFADFGFSYIDLYDSKRLDDKYFKDEAGQYVSNVNRTHFIVVAKKV